MKILNTPSFKLAPDSVVRELLIPLVSRFPLSWDIRIDMLSYEFLIKLCNTETRTIRHLDEAVLYQWMRKSLYKILPPWNVYSVELHSKYIVHSSCYMNCCHTCNRTLCHMDCHSYAVLVCHICDLLKLKSTTTSKDIRVDY